VGFDALTNMANERAIWDLSDKLLPETYDALKQKKCSQDTIAGRNDHEEDMKHEEHSEHIGRDNHGEYAA
jgi:hypothetical protein